MESIKWKNPGRKRHQDLSYTSPDFVKGYDLDQEDFTYINEKKKEFGDYRIETVTVDGEVQETACLTKEKIEQTDKDALHRIEVFLG